MPWPHDIDSIIETFPHLIGKTIAKVTADCGSVDNDGTYYSVLFEFIDGTKLAVTEGGQAGYIEMEERR